MAIQGWVAGKKMNYRADIDGLRCLAVMAVVAYHFGLLGASGGFVGVDVFFVISGYLITGIVWRQLRDGQFSLTQFYERRFRRIIPALVVVFLFTSGFAAVVHMPLDFKEYGESLLAASLFLSNFYFYIKTGYFNGEAELRPLLHTWSLSVEEQFYVVLPLVLLILSRVPRQAKWWLAAFGVASCAAAQLFIDTAPQAVFFMIWFRAWELLIGALLAVIALPRPADWFRNGIGVVGLALIIIPIWGYTSATPFPGAAALLPTVGAAALIYSGSYGRHPAGWIISLPWVVFVGKISYSLYLWHWPIVSFFQYLQNREPTNLEGGAMLLVSTLLAYATWRWVEQPWRHRASSGKNVTREPAFQLAFASIAVGVGFGLVCHLTKGVPQRLPEQVAQKGQAAFDTNPNRSRCDSPSIERINAGEVCKLGIKEGEPTFILIGDSFADTFAPGLDLLAREHGRTGLVINQGGCLPLKAVNQGVRGCTETVDAQLAFIRARPEIETVVLAGRWTTAAEGRRFGVNRESLLLVTDEASDSPALDENPRVFERGLRRTLEALAGKRIFVVAYVPEQEVNVPRRLALDAYLNRPQYAGVSKSKYDERQMKAREIIGRLEKIYGFSVVDVGQRLCNSAICSVETAGRPLYVDDNHLSRSTAVSLRGLLSSAMSPTEVLSSLR